MTHALKTWPEFFKAVDSGEKNFEVRRFDRPFKVGDTLLLQEWKPEGYNTISPNTKTGTYTGKEIKRIITYILKGDTNFGVFGDFCIMGLKEIENY